MPITPLLAAIFALIYVALSIAVIRLRLGNRISLGHKDNRKLETTIRAHANFVEYVPLALLVFGFIERLTFNSFFVLIAGGVLLIARLMHVVGMHKPKQYMRYRQLGVLLTLLVLLTSGLYLLWWYVPYVV